MKHVFFSGKKNTKSQVPFPNLHGNLFWLWQKRFPVVFFVAVNGSRDSFVYCRCHGHWDFVSWIRMTIWCFWWVFPSIMWGAACGEDQWPVMGTNFQLQNNFTIPMCLFQKLARKMIPSHHRSWKFPQTTYTSQHPESNPFRDGDSISIPIPKFPWEWSQFDFQGRLVMGVRWKFVVFQM